MNTHDLDRMHSDPDNWHLMFFYICSEDPRLVVKKRVGSLGWTLNFARPLAIPFLLVLIAGIYGVMRLSDMLAFDNKMHWVSVVLIIIGIVSLCSWLANPNRYITECEQDSGSNGGQRR